MQIRSWSRILADRQMKEINLRNTALGEEEREIFIYMLLLLVREEIYIAACYTMLIYIYRVGPRFAFECSWTGPRNLAWRIRKKKNKKKHEKGGEIGAIARENELNTKIGILFYKCWLLLNVEYCSATNSRVFARETRVFITQHYFLL